MLDGKDRIVKNAHWHRDAAMELVINLGNVIVYQDGAAGTVQFVSY